MAGFGGRITFRRREVSWASNFLLNSRKAEGHDCAAFPSRTCHRLSLLSPQHGTGIQRSRTKILRQ